MTRVRVLLILIGRHVRRGHHERTLVEMKMNNEYDEYREYHTYIVRY